MSRYRNDSCGFSPTKSEEIRSRTHLNNHISYHYKSYSKMNNFITIDNIINNNTPFFCSSFFYCVLIKFSHSFPLWQGVVNLGLVAIPASIVNSLLQFFTNMLSIRFRKRLSKYIHEKYMHGLTFYKAANNESIDNMYTSKLNSFLSHPFALCYSPLSLSNSFLFSLTLSFFSFSNLFTFTELIL